MFFARIVTSENALGLKFVLIRSRGNLDATAAARIETPAVITAFDRFTVEAPVRKRNAPVRAGIAHRERFAVGRATQHERNFEQHRRSEPGTDDFRAAQRRIPKIPQETEVGFPRLLTRGRIIHLDKRSRCVAHRSGLIDAGFIVLCSSLGSHRNIAPCEVAIFAWAIRCPGY